MRKHSVTVTVPRQRTCICESITTLQSNYVFHLVPEKLFQLLQVNPLPYPYPLPYPTLPYLPYPLQAQCNLTKHTYLPAL